MQPSDNASNPSGESTSDNRPVNEASHISPRAKAVIATFEKQYTQTFDKKIIVNPVVSKFASWYEKFRNAMDYREEEVILRAAIERILKRRLIFDRSANKIAQPLVRELVWARYFPNESLSESVIAKVAEKIDLYLKLQHHLLSKKDLKEGEIHDWIRELLSSDLEHLLNPRPQKEAMSNFIFQVLKEHVSIADDSEQTRDVQVFIAVRRAFAKDDLAFLRYHLFTQYFGQLTSHTLPEISQNFHTGYKEIQAQLNYPRKERIFSYVKSRAAVFFILEDVLEKYGPKAHEVVNNKEELKKAVYEACEARYAGISSKVQRAIIRSVIFILLSKAFFAFAVETTVDRFLYGEVEMTSILINFAISPILMIIVGFFIHPPGEDNTKKIFAYIETVLHNDKPQIAPDLIVQKNPDRNRSLLITIFSVLWFLAFFIAFGLVIYVLTFLQFKASGQAIFLFFLAIVSFLAYRIALIPQTFSVEDRQGVLTPIVDFFFMPIIRVGRHLTAGISQINIFIFLFDFVIEMPFKVIFMVVEQWFVFLHAKREDLG